MKQYLLAIAILVVVGLLLAGCSAGGNSQESNPSITIIDGGVSSPQGACKAGGVRIDAEDRMIACNDSHDSGPTEVAWEDCSRELECAEDLKRHEEYRQDRLRDRIERMERRNSQARTRDRERQRRED